MGRWITKMSCLACLFACSACAEAVDEPQPSTQTTSAALNSGVEQQLRQKVAQLGGTSTFVLPKSNQFNKIPQDPKNPLNAAKVKLGKLLMHETGMGVKNVQPEGYQTYSCATCHHADAGFQAGRRQGIGEGAEGFFTRSKRASYDEFKLDVQPVRSPSILNGAYQEVMLWNGQFGATGPNAGTQAQWTPSTPKAKNFLGFQGLEIQAIAGMEVHRLSFVDSPLVNNNKYKKLFKRAFKGQPSQRMTDLNAALAIAAFERTVLANDSSWQKWLRGKPNAMSEAQKRGALLFLGKANCVSCHTGPALNSMSFHALGMGDFGGADILGAGRTNPESLGRGGFTQDPNDMFKFKTPQLYNLIDSPFYGHGGTFTSIRQVLEYKNQAVPQRTVPASQMAAEFVPLGLTTSELDDLEAFVTWGLYDPKLSRYEPGKLPSKLCLPNNDDQSRQDLGCD